MAEQRSQSTSRTWAPGDRVCMAGATGTVSYVPVDPRGWISIHWDGTEVWRGARVLASWLEAA